MKTVGSPSRLCYLLAEFKRRLFEADCRCACGPDFVFLDKRRVIVGVTDLGGPSLNLSVSTFRSVFKKSLLSRLFNLSLRSFFILTFAMLVNGTFASVSYGWWMWTPGDTVDDVGYKPTQPIPYSHKLHAGDLKIPCQYCHAAARRSTAAGIPPLNTCMGCHKVVRTDRDPIKTITEHFKANKPMEWVKVHDLPDFVKFSHKPHVLAGLECQTCHGQVQDMEVIEQVAPLQMGWCIGCHKDKGAPTTCNTCHY